jgi:hypothetical protein
LKKTLIAGCSKTVRYKAPGSGDPPEGWGLQAKRGVILRSEAYITVRRNAVDGRFSATCYLVTLIPEVISKIGNKIAMTMKPTTAPMNRITTGSMMEVSEVMVASTSSS